MAQHTPGEWRAEPCGEAAPKSDRLIIAYLGKNESGTQIIRTIGRVFSHGGAEETEANAQLIAAAPDLAESLKDVLRIIEAVRYTAGLGKGQMERVKKAKAALAKAGVWAMRSTPDYDLDDVEEPYEDGPEPGEECGRWSNGRLARHCSKAGSEECDFECPYRGRQCPK